MQCTYYPIVLADTDRLPPGMVPGTWLQHGRFCLASSAGCHSLQGESIVSNVVGWCTLVLTAD